MNTDCKLNLEVVDLKIESSDVRELAAEIMSKLESSNDAGKLYYGVCIMRIFRCV